MKYIELTQGQRARVSDEDWEELSKYKWYAAWCPKTRSFRAARKERRNGKHQTIYMHRVIVGAQPGEHVDHRYHATLNNQRENLRRCTNSQNHQNQRPRRGRISAFNGIYWDRQTRKWRARITLAGRLHHLGYFTDEQEAARAYDAKAHELFTSFALTNF